MSSLSEILDVYTYIYIYYSFNFSNACTHIIVISKWAFNYSTTQFIAGIKDLVFKKVEFVVITIKEVRKLLSW